MSSRTRNLYSLLTGRLKDYVVGDPEPYKIEWVVADGNLQGKDDSVAFFQLDGSVPYGKLDSYVTFYTDVNLGAFDDDYEPAETPTIVYIPEFHKDDSKVTDPIYSGWFYRVGVRDTFKQYGNAGRMYMTTLKRVEGIPTELGDFADALQWYADNNRDPITENPTEEIVTDFEIAVQNLQLVSNEVTTINQ